MRILTILSITGVSLLMSSLAAIGYETHHYRSASHIGIVMISTVSWALFAGLIGGFVFVLLNELN